VKSRRIVDCFNSRAVEIIFASTSMARCIFDNIAAIERGVRPACMERYNRQFQVSVNASNAPDFPLDAAARATGEKIRKVGLPSGYSYRFTGAVKILDETTRNPIIAFLLASIFMYMVLAAQFESFLHPFTIMLNLPLSIPFALFSLFVTHRTLNLWSALGVRLSGIVKKNGILQADYTNKLRDQGVLLRQGIVQANHVRLIAPDPDDDTVDRGGIDSHDHRHRGGLGPALRHCRDHHRGTNIVLFADPARYTRGLFDFCRNGRQKVFRFCSGAVVVTPGGCVEIHQHDARLTAGWKLPEGSLTSPA
jgi:hypothetical protein